MAVSLGIALAGIGSAAVYGVSLLQPPAPDSERMIGGSFPAPLILDEFPSGLRRAYRTLPPGSSVAADPADRVFAPAFVPDKLSRFRDHYH